MPNNQEQIIDPENRRKYIRLGTRYAVDFSIVRLQGDMPGVSHEKGFTQDISEGGLCLETDALTYQVFKYLVDNNIYLEMKIQTPVSLIKAVGEARWFRETHPGHYMIGVHFRSIPRKNLNSLMGQTRVINRLLWIGVVIASGILFGLVLLELLRQSATP